MVRWSLSDGNGIAFLFGSCQGDREAILRIHTAHLQWEMGQEKVAQTLPVPPFPGGLPQPHGYPTRGRKKYKINSSIKQRPLVVALWNASTLLDTGFGVRRSTALITCKLAGYYIDIAALSETRLPDEGSIVEMGTGYTFVMEWPTHSCPLHSWRWIGSLDCAFAVQPKIPHCNEGATHDNAAPTC